MAHERNSFGQYTLLKKIGEGGMAEVHLARSAAIREIVALKRIKRDLAQRPDIRELFDQEGSLALKLKHPSIVESYETGEHEGVQYICMEYVAGIDLARFIPALLATGLGAVPLRYALLITRQVCEALHYAHELRDSSGRSLNIVNRDIDPSNIRLAFTGQVKLLDFGIARALTGLRSEIGQVKGKFSYMSPEQARCMAVDRRSDIFATGIVLHEMLTGKRLFRGHDVASTLAKVRHAEAAAPSRANPEVPPGLDGIVLKALALDRHERYDTAAEMAAALAAVSEEFPATPKQLAALMREVARDEWRRSEGERRSLAEGAGPEQELALEETLPSQQDFQQHVSLSATAPLQAAPATPRWVYWAFIPTSVLFVIALYLVLR